MSAQVSPDTPGQWIMGLAQFDKCRVVALDELKAEALLGAAGANGAQDEDRA